MKIEKEKKTSFFGSLYNLIMRFFVCSDYPHCNWSKWGNKKEWINKITKGYWYSTQERTCEYCGKTEVRKID